MATSNISHPDQSSCVSFSFAKMVPIPIGTRYNMDYYGDSPDDLHVHMTHHLAFIAPRSMHGGIHFEVMAPQSFGNDVVMEVIKKIPGLKISRGLRTAYFIQGPVKNFAKL